MALLTCNRQRSAEQQIPLEKSSSLYRLSPMLDASGILRVEGRIAAAPNVADSMKFPIILPMKHRFTHLLLNDCHRRYRHCNAETVINEVRQHYYVPQLRVAVKQIGKLASGANFAPNGSTASGGKTFHPHRHRLLRITAGEGCEALTPNHFLLGSSGGIRQSARESENPVAELQSAWNEIQDHLDTFWRRWIREYLPTLTRRTKWFGEMKPRAVGDLVVIIDESARNRWERGRILEVIKGTNERIWQAVVQTGRGLILRSVAKLAVLEVDVGGKTGPDGQCYGGGRMLVLAARFRRATK